MQHFCHRPIGYSFLVHSKFIFKHHALLSLSLLLLLTDVAIDHVEGGIYIGPEFLLGEVYDGCNVSDNEYRDLAPLYRPVYLTVVRSSQQISARAVGRANRKKSCDVEIAEIHRK